MDVALAIASILLNPLSAMATPLEEMHGKTYKTISSAAFGIVQLGLPDDLEDQGGWLVGSATIEQPFVMSVYSQGETRVLSFEKILSNRRYTHRDIYVNEQERQIFDSVIAPLEGDWLSSCHVVGEEGDPEIVAIAPPYEESHFDTEWFTKFQGVWRANRETQQLEPMSSENVRCYNMGYLYDG